MAVMFWCYLIAALVVALDQISKLIVIDRLMPVGSVPLIEGVFHFTYVENTGVAFGMMKDKRWIFMAVSVLAILILVYAIAKYSKEYKFAGIALAMTLGGGIGNMIDRVRLGYVVDFIDFRLINFAVFNIADSFVTIGAALLIFFLVCEMAREFRSGKHGKSVAENAGNVGTSSSGISSDDGCNGQKDSGEDGIKDGDASNE